MNIVSYEVKIIENAFTWCGHESHTMIMEYENYIFIYTLMIFLILEINLKIIHEK